MATTELNPYLNFNGTAREAMDFYHSVFGGEITRMTFREGGMPGVPDDELDLVMHSQLDVGDETLLMGADLPSHMEFVPAAGMTVALSGDDVDTLRGWWEQLSEGATIGEPLTKAPWGDWFGMLTDRFGTPWMVNISGGGQS